MDWTLILTLSALFLILMSGFFFFWRMAKKEEAAVLMPRYFDGELWAKDKGLGDDKLRLRMMPDLEENLLSGKAHSDVEQMLGEGMGRVKVAEHSEGKVVPDGYVWSDSWVLEKREKDSTVLVLFFDDSEEFSGLQVNTIDSASLQA